MQDRYSNIPNHLKEFIVSQDYDNYTAIDHACWRFIMEISKKFFNKGKMYFPTIIGIEGRKFIFRYSKIDKNILSQIKSLL